ncbi:MAG TPA: glycoside hydrolase domain-containing protein [Kofleriaceae bacterium]|nr:glycoside hydrolase domain-containing protein [Kofleriaceae bacterium]
MSNTTPLPGSVAGAPIGALGCDTLGVLSADHVKTLAEAGYKFCVRYVNLPNYASEPALTSAEAQTILQGGLALMVVQRARAGTLTASGGTSDGSYAAQSCADIGLPRGVNVWLDLESIGGDVFNYSNNWYTEVANAGYKPGVYVGPNISYQDTPVTGEQLYAYLKASHYWRSQSEVPNVDQRGYQMIQLFTQTKDLLGFYIDINVTQNDYRNDTVQWLQPASC